VSPGSASAADDAPSARSGQVVAWLETEFLLPAPWRALASDGGALLLEHPSAAGPGGPVYVTMVAEDGQLSAAQMAALPAPTVSGEVLATEELDTVFATGGPGFRVGTAGTSRGVGVYSDTGISVSISRDEGVLTEADVATVLALLATIEPPAVTPSTDRVGVAAAAPPPPDGSVMSYGRDGRLSPRIEIGEAGWGWDSSAYPDLPPSPIPDGFVMSWMYDGDPLSYNARRWHYAGPPGVDLLSLCLRTRDRIVATGGRLLDGDCENRAGRREGVSEDYAVLGFRPDGASVLVFIQDGSDICPTLPLDRNCTLWSFGMNLTPPG